MWFSVRTGNIANSLVRYVIWVSESISHSVILLLVTGLKLLSTAAFMWFSVRARNIANSLVG
jgi:hypothetical protein